MRISTLVIAFALLMAVSHAWTPFRFETQQDMLEYMRDEDHNIYIIFFYNSDQPNKAATERMRQIVVTEREAIRRNVLDAFDNIVYAELDLAGGHYDEVAHEIGIETADTLEYPTVVAVDDGIGKWVNGPDLVQLLVPTVKALILRNQN